MLCDGISGQGDQPDIGILLEALERCSFQSIASEAIEVGGEIMEMNTGITTNQVINDSRKE